MSFKKQNRAEEKSLNFIWDKMYFLLLKEKMFDFVDSKSISALYNLEHVHYWRLTLRLFDIDNELLKD